MKRRNHKHDDDYEVDQNNHALAACMRAKLLHAREECTCEQGQPHNDFERQNNIDVERRRGAKNALIQRTTSLAASGWIASCVPILCDPGDCDSALNLGLSLRAH